MVLQCTYSNCNPTLPTTNQSHTPSFGVYTGIFDKKKKARSSGSEQPLLLKRPDGRRCVGSPSEGWGRRRPEGNS